MSGYLRDIALRKQLEEKVKEATRTRKDAESELEEAKRAVTAARELDADVSEAEGPLAEATAAMGAKDYRLALEKASEAHARGKRVYEERVRDIVNEAGKLIQLANSLDLDMSDAPANLKKAGETLTQDDFAEAVDYARKAWKRAEKTLHEHLSESFSKAQSLILVAKKLDRDTDPLANLIDQARSAMEANDFESALTFTRECLDTVTQDLKSEFGKVLADTQGIVRTAGEIGAETAKAQSLVERAEHDASQDEFEKALNALKLAHAEAERALQRNLDGSSAKFAALLERAERIGTPTASARERFEAAERAIKEDRFAEGAAAAQEGMQILAKAQFDRLALVMSQSRSKFMDAINLGADVSAAKDFMNRARIAAQKGDFEQAFSFVEKADRELDRVVSKFRDAETQIRDLYRVLAEAETLGVKTAAARAALDAARSSLQEKNVARTAGTVRKAQAELERAEYERTKEVVEEAEGVLSSGERMAGDLSAASKMLEEAMAATKEKEYRRAIDRGIRARALAEDAIRGRIQADLDGLRESLEFLGEDAAGVRGLIPKAEGALTANDLEGAFAYIGQAHKIAEGKTRDRAVDLAETLKMATTLGRDLGDDVTELEGVLNDANAAVSASRFPEILGMSDRISKVLGAASESHFGLLKRRVLDVKNVPDVFEDGRELLKRAKIALGVEDYSSAYRLMMDCSERASQALDQYRRTHNAISSAAALVAEARKREVDVSKVLEMLLEAKKAFERQDFEKALDWANRSKTETEKLMILYSSAQKILLSRERIDLAGRLGVEAPHLKDMLDRAKEAMKSKDYPKALTLAEKSEREIADLIRDKVAGLLSTAEGVIATMDEVDLSAVEEKIGRSRQHLNAAEWSQGADLALGARDDLEKLMRLGQEADLAIQKARDLIAEVEAMNLDAPSARKTVEKAERAYKAGRFADALELATKAMDELGTERDENVARMMKTFEEAIAKARREGVDTRTADRRLEKARELLASGQYRQALSLAMQAEGEAERIGLQQDMASKAIQTAEKKISGFVRPIPDVESIVAEAKDAFDAGDYVKALDLAIQSGDEFTHVREATEEAMEVRTTAENLVKVAFEIGADAVKIEKIFKEGEAALESGKPEDARAAFQQSTEWGLGLCRAHLEEALKRGQEYVEVCRRLGVDESPALKRISEAKAHLEGENFESAFHLIQEGKKAARDALSHRVRESIEQTRGTIEHARKIGAEVGDADELVKTAEEALAAGQFEQALRHIEDAQGRVEGDRAVEKRFVELTFKAESSIRNARKYGIEVKAAEAMLQRAIRMKPDDLAQAILRAEEAYRAAWEAVEAFAPSLQANLEVGDAILGEWADAKLVLVNDGKALAKDVEVRILGDVEVEGLRTIPTIRARASETLSLRVKMTALGEIPLAIQVISHRVIDDKEYVQEMIATVQVAEAAAKVERGPVVAAFDSRCPICKGKIKKGFTIAKCQCGRDFHELCASRVGRCPVCFRTIRAESKTRVSLR